MNDTNLGKNMMRTVCNTAISKAEYHRYLHRNALNVVLGKLNKKRHVNYTGQCLSSHACPINANGRVTIIITITKEESINCLYRESSK